MTAPARTTARRMADVVAQLTETDQAVASNLASLRLATTAQLWRLHFADKPQRAGLRAAQRCLTKLTALSVVVRLDRRIGGVRAGSAGQVYALGVLGQHLLRASAGQPPRRPWTPSLLFVRHRLAITELYVQLVEAERRGELALAAFTAEPACWRSFTAAHGGLLWLKPDASLVTTTGDYEDRWFVEIDCATESPLVLERKARRYLAYQASGQEQRTCGVFPRVLFVVPHEPRRAVVERSIRQLAATERELFRVTLATTAVDVIRRGAA